MKKSGILSLLVIFMLVIFISLVGASWFEDAWNKITGRAVENETEGTNETEAEECAASISINFNQDVYYSGDLFKVTIEVFDSQGNRIPNYPFHLRIYAYSEDRWDLSEYPDPEYTNEQGYVEHSAIVDYIPEGHTEKGLYKVYTQETSSCSKVEDTTEIELSGEEEETEPEPEPEPAPTVCAAKIVINFDKDVYYIGDEFKVVIEVFDSQGNRIPNYLFYTQAYDDGMWHSTGSDRTDERGYKIHQEIIRESQVHLFGENKFRIYTESYTNCNSVEDLAMIEIRRRERAEPVPCGIGTCIPEEEAEEVEAIPEEEIFYKCNGCELEGKCYPMGYRKEGKYCSDNNEFVGQSKAGTCDNHFECESNVCISSECVGESFIKRIIKWFKRLFGIKPEPEEPGLKMCSKLLIEKDIGDYKYVESAYGHKDHQVALYSEDGEQIDIVKCCIAVYENPDGTEGVGVVCPFDNKKDVENTIYWLANKEDLILRENYNGQKVYGGSEPEPGVIVWTSDAYIIASGGGSGEGQLPEEVADAYLKKYKNDLGEIEISGVDELPSNFESLSPKEQVELIHMRNFKYLIAGDAKRLVAAYSSVYLDIGGGPNGTGEVQLDEAFEDFFLSERFDEIRGKPISELVDLDKKEVFMDSRRGQFGDRVEFRHMEGDIVVIFPPKEDSLLFDGWSAIYRKENGLWKIIAAD